MRPPKIRGLSWELIKAYSTNKACCQKHHCWFVWCELVLRNEIIHIEYLLLPQPGVRVLFDVEGFWGRLSLTECSKQG